MKIKGKYKNEEGRKEEKEEKGTEERRRKQ